MRDVLIKWLGGYTEEAFDEVEKDYYETFNEMVRRGDTIRELKAPVPQKKKRGRSRKVKDVIIKGKAETSDRMSYVGSKG